MQVHSTVPRVCDRCGQTFEALAKDIRRGRGRYCSKACIKGPRAEKWEARACALCGESFTARHYKPTLFCSRACYNAAPRQRTSDPLKQTASTCPTCGKSFTYYLCWPRTYCSHSCRNTALNLRSSYQALCDQCGKEFETIPSQSARFCSQACWGGWMSVNRAGENSSNWRGGYDAYYGATWYPARRAARERDGICQDCGISPDILGKELDVHHIAPFRRFGRERHEEANRLDNLVSLCPTCHTTREWATNWRESPE
jgi:hypothetical protein